MGFLILVLNHANIVYMKDYIMREKLRIRAYNALVDYLGSIIKREHPEYDRITKISYKGKTAIIDDNGNISPALFAGSTHPIIHEKKPCDGWMHVTWEDSDRNLYEYDVDFNVLICTQLLSGAEAENAIEVEPFISPRSNVNSMRTDNVSIREIEEDEEAPRENEQEN